MLCICHLVFKARSPYYGEANTAAAWEQLNKAVANDMEETTNNQGNNHGGDNQENSEEDNEKENEESDITSSEEENEEEHEEASLPTTPPESDSDNYDVAHPANMKNYLICQHTEVCLYFVSQFFLLATVCYVWTNLIPYLI